MIYVVSFRPESRIGSNFGLFDLYKILRSNVRVSFSCETGSNHRYILLMGHEPLGHLTGDWTYTGKKSSTANRRPSKYVGRLNTLCERPRGIATSGITTTRSLHTRRSVSAVGSDYRTT